MTSASKTADEGAPGLRPEYYCTFLRDPDGNPLPPAPRTRICQVAANEHHFRPYFDGSWYRCCGGHVRRLTDCCGYVRSRINGDAALTGYCYSGRRVFCVMYYDSKIRC